MVSLIKAVVAALMLTAGFLTAPAEPSTPPAEIVTTPCEGTVIDEIFGGLVADVPVLVYPDSYFEGREAHWGFVPGGLYIHGPRVIAIPQRHCDRMQGSPFASPSALDSFNLLMHEAAHALDHKYEWMSADIDFEVEGIAHAAHSSGGHRELFAFCMQAIAMGADLRDRCPDSNREAVLEAITEVTGMTATGRLLYITEST